MKFTIFPLWEDDCDAGISDCENIKTVHKIVSKTKAILAFLFKAIPPFKAFKRQGRLKKALTFIVFYYIIYV